MNSALKTAQKSSNCSQLRAAFFHSTPVLDRKRRSHWEPRFSSYARRPRRMYAKQTLLRNVSAFAEDLIQSWQSDFCHDDLSSSRGTSWFRRHCGAKKSKRDWMGNQRCGRRGFQFCEGEDDHDVETIFRSALGGKRCFSWSFLNDEIPQWRSFNNHKTSWNSRFRFEDEYDSSTESDSSEQDLTSERRALGLNAAGPLKLEDVKIAYRSCALKWHPDRHEGSSKIVAEEKFKLCSSAYQSLCEKLALD